MPPPTTACFTLKSAAASGTISATRTRWVALGALDEGPSGWDDHDRLFVATRENELWARRAVLEEIGWEKIGHARNVVALCGVGESLFCVTSGDRLWQRPAEGGDVEWQQVGGAPGVAAMLGLAGRLYYVDGQGTLFASNPVENPGAWQRISSLPLQPFDLPE